MSQQWIQRLLHWHGKYQQLMKGRYRRFDELNKSLLIFAFVSLLLHRFLPLHFGRPLAYSLLFLVIYRIGSKRIYPRLNENTKYLRIMKIVDAKINQLMQFFDRKKTRHQTDTTNVQHYSFFACPVCGQNLRAPIGKGKVKITCSKCQHQFLKKL